MTRLFYSKVGENGHLSALSLLECAFSLLYSAPLPRIEKTSDGKPFFPERKDVHFSLSHSKKYALCTVSSENVGADTESERFVQERTVLYVTSPCEREEFAFLESWVMKESFIKLTGVLDRPLRDVIFTKNGGEITGPNGCRAKLYALDNDSLAAVCAYSSELPEKAEYIEI